MAQEQEELLEAKEQKEETEPPENNESTKDEVNEVESATKAAEENTTSEVMGEVQHSVNEENVAQDDMRADLLEEPKPTDAEAAERYEAEEEKSAVETDIQPDETGQGAKTREEDESSISELNKKTDEPTVPDNAEELAACETMEIKAESSEEREALSCEEAPVTDTEERQEADSKERPPASETANAAEDSSSSPEGSRDTTVEKNADEEITRDESSKDDIKVDAEQTSQAEASDDSQLKQCELADERTEKSGEADETEKQKPEKEKEEGEKQMQMNPDKMAEDEKTEEEENDEIDKTEVEHNDESKGKEGREEEENTTEEEADTNTEERKAEEKEAEKNITEDSNEENNDKSAEKDKNSEHVEIKNEDKESGAEKNLTEDSNEENNDKPAEKDENSEHVEIKDEDKESKVKEGEERSELNTAVEEEDDEAETSEKDETGAEQSKVTEIKNGEESEEQRDVTEGEEMSEHTEEPDKSDEVDKENLKGSSVAEADDVGGSEAVADGTEETLNSMIETEKEKETETEKVTSEKAEIDAENGEISGAKGQPPDNEGEAPTEDTNDLKPAENNEEERQTQESTEELTGESAEKHQDDKVDPDPNTDVTKSDAKEEDDSDERHEGSIKNDSEPETSGTEMKEEPKLDDRKDSEETEKYENDNKSDFEKENRESESNENNSNIQNFAPSDDQEQTSAPLAADLDDAANRLDEDKTDKHPHTETTLGADLSAADGENGADTEEASKASEEGASVLLKPQAQSNEADNTEQAATVNNKTPEVLASEDNTDLVTNWVNVHQSSKFFETFIEPLEDMREEISDSQVSSSVREEAQSIELQTRSESPLKMARKSEDEENTHKMVESELYSTQAEDEPRENNPAKDALQEEEEEETEVKALIPTTDTEQNDSTNGSRASLEEDKNQHEPTQGISEDNVVSKPEMESASGTDHSAPESAEKQTDEKHADNVPDMNTNHPNTEDPLFPFNTEEPLMSKSPDGLKDADETREQTDVQSRNVTEITDFTTSKSDEESQEESRSGEIQSKASDRRDVQLIQDIKHTLSKDRLSTFSVDETLFGRSSYPLPTAGRAESGH